MALETRADVFLQRRGEQVNVYRRTATGAVDEFNRPEYTWALVYSTGIWSRWDRIRRTEEIYVAGERVDADYRVLLQSDADVLRNDQLSWNSERWDVRAIDPINVTGVGQFLRAYVKRLIE
jgi:hypothetical protein